MPPFTPIPDHLLDRRSDDELIAYVRAAIDAGDAESGATALAILVFGYWENVRRRVSMKVPSADVEDVAADAVASAIGSAFHGTSVGEFRNWLWRIVARRIADYFRSREGAPAVVSLFGADGALAHDPGGPAADAAVEARDVVERVLATLNDLHRRVVELYALDGHSARETAGQVPGMSEDNVHQIARRFREALKAEASAGDTEGR